MLVAWREPEGPARFAMLLARMRPHGVPDDLREISSITYRLQRMLSNRPLLAPNDADLRAIATALAAHRRVSKSRPKPCSAPSGLRFRGR